MSSIPLGVLCAPTQNGPTFYHRTQSVIGNEEVATELYLHDLIYSDLEVFRFLYP